MSTQLYSSGQIDSFLLSYQIFVTDLAELTLEWDTLDAEDRSDYQTDLLQIWSNRKVLGTLFKTGQLTSVQSNRLATLDRHLFEQSGSMNHCFGFDLSQLLAIFQWGTPLTKSEQPLQIEVEPMLLDRMASAVALLPVG